MTAPLTTEQHLIIRLGEECAEIIQRVSKYLTYGSEETQEGQTASNHERLEAEIIDFLGTMTLACEQGLLPNIAQQNQYYQDRAQAKKDKVAKFMVYAKNIGMLKD